MPSSRLSPLAAPAISALPVLALFWLLASLVEAQINERLREGQQIMLSELRSEIEGEINSSVNLTAGLIAYISVHADINQNTFESIAARLFAERSVVRNISLAPNNVIRYVYPPVGNEAALGTNLLAHDVQGWATRQVLQHGEAILAGPVELVQGGKALIHRVPIYVNKELDEAPSYWGLLSTPIDYDRLLEQTGVNAVAQKMALALRGADAMGGRGMVFYGNAGLFDQSDSLISTVQVLNGSWQIAARPIKAQGWQQRWPVLILQSIGLLLAGLVALFSWRFMAQTKLLRDSERQYRELAEHLEDVVFQTDAERRVIYLSPAWSRLTGHSVASSLGKDWVEILDPQDRPRARAHCISLLQQAHPGKPYLDEFQVRSADGLALWIVVRANVHRDDKGNVIGSIGTMVDISERKLAEQHVHHLAMHDNLTGLPNRLLLEDRFVQAQARLQRQGNVKAGGGAGVLAFLYLDLDGFKAVNDQHGHDGGDLVLRAVAERLAAQLREVDTLARLGGDEFAVLLDCQGNPDEAILVAEKLIEVIRPVFELGDHACQLGMSIGISFYPRFAHSLNELISQSDRAMYRAKLSGKGCWRIYSPEIDM
jgi:diguanylate cyclase (GGDEF)-like protein/PAS domain S-box-containing protein